MGEKTPGPICRTRGHDCPDKQTLNKSRSKVQRPAGTQKKSANFQEQELSTWDSFTKSVNDTANDALNTVWDTKSFSWVLAKILKQLGEDHHSWKFKFFAHYLSGGGEAMAEFTQVPMDWQNAIRQNWRKTGSIRRDVMKAQKANYPKGKFRIKPYNWGVEDLTGALGHFDLTYSKQGKTETYLIEDYYEFPYYDESDGLLKDHGATLPASLPKWMTDKLISLLPTRGYAVPEGKSAGSNQKFKIVQKNDGSLLLTIPTGWLQANGKAFNVSASFKNQFNIEKYIAAFDEESYVFWEALDEDDLAHDLIFVTSEAQQVKVFNHLKAKRPSDVAAVAKYFVEDLVARTSPPTIADLSKKPALTNLLRSFLNGTPIASKLPAAKK